MVHSNNEGVLKLERLKYVLMLIVVLAYFAGRHMPVTWGWENGPLEWSQVVILAAGMLLTGHWRQEAKRSGNRPHVLFFTWAIPLWLLMIGRELSWGRVFYPLGVDAVDGPFFIPVSELPYGSVVYPLIAAVILAWLFAVITYKLYQVPYELYRQGHFPRGEFLLVIFSFIVADIAEKSLDYQILEEIAECVAYFSLVLTAYRVKAALQETNKIRRNNFFRASD